MSEIQWFEEARHLSQLVLGARRRSAAELMDVARRRTGLDDFGREPIEAPLEYLLTSYREDRRLNTFGRIATHWDNLRLLTNRLILRDRERADPAILRRPIERPIFILGMPRSGTTFLHKLLAQDPDSQVLRCWQAVYPCPDHPAAGRGAGPDRVQSEFSLFHRIAPELKKIHPFHAHTPQECGEITAHSFRSLRFDATYDTPSYRRWVRQTALADAFSVHRRFLQHLQGNAPKRWVLKWPDHVFAMEALRTAYPDARIVFSHRDPLKVLPSLARLSEVMRRPFVRRLDRAALGRQVAEDWVEGTGRMLDAHAYDLWPPAQTAHVRFKALTAEPVATVKALYDRFGLGFTPAFEARIREFVARHPKGGYGRNPCRLEDFGLHAGELRDRFGSYTRGFDVEQEVRIG